jgi:hypothetical protein
MEKGLKSATPSKQGGNSGNQSKSHKGTKSNIEDPSEYDRRDNTERDADSSSEIDLKDLQAAFFIGIFQSKSSGIPLSYQTMLVALTMCEMSLIRF